MKIKELLAPALIIVFAVALRLLPHPPNFAPIAALALFGGVYLDKKFALALPLIAMAISDIFLGFSPSTPFVYGCFILTGLLGTWIRKRKTVQNIFLASLASSILFFLVTNFGYWLSNSLYPKTFTGQLQAYYFALPFFRNTILGDLFYTTLFFGSYELATYFLKQKIQISSTK